MLTSSKTSMMNPEQLIGYFETIVRTNNGEIDMEFNL